MLDLSGNHPAFHWPSHNVVQTAVEGIDLGAQPQGPPVGSQVVWEMSENECITWTRKRDEQVMRFGPGGRMYLKQNTRKMNDYSICFVVPSCL
jgi:hypothetical protein